MRGSKMQEHLEYDLGTAAFLVVEGFRLVGTAGSAKHRMAFRFENDHGKCSEAVLQYFQGASVPAKALVAAQKDLKILLYSKDGDGNGNDRKELCGKGNRPRISMGRG
jgi:hypothetical protein